MPEIRSYKVTQTRIVRVDANSAVDAACIANAAFEHGQNIDQGVIMGPPGIFGNTTSRIRETDLEVREDW